MPYNKYTWKDGPEGETPITADRLNHIEDGISNHDAVESNPHNQYLFSDAKKLTVASSPPQNPNVNDLWIEI